MTLSNYRTIIIGHCLCLQTKGLACYGWGCSARAQGIREKLLKHDNTNTQPHQLKTIMTFVSASPLCYQQTKGYAIGLPTKTFQIFYDRSSNSNFLCTQAPCSWNMISPPLSLANKGRYLPPLQVLLLLLRSLNSRSTNARDLSKPKIPIYLTQESYIYR